MNIYVSILDLILDRRWVGALGLNILVGYTRAEILDRATAAFMSVGAYTARPTLVVHLRGRRPFLDHDPGRRG